MERVIGSTIEYADTDSDAYLIVIALVVLYLLSQLVQYVCLKKKD